MTIPDRVYTILHRDQWQAMRAITRQVRGCTSAVHYALQHGVFEGEIEKRWIQGVGRGRPRAEYRIAVRNRQAAA